METVSHFSKQRQPASPLATALVTFFMTHSCNFFRARSTMRGLDKHCPNCFVRPSTSRPNPDPNWIPVVEEEVKKILLNLFWLGTKQPAHHNRTHPMLVFIAKFWLGMSLEPRRIICTLVVLHERNWCRDVEFEA